MVKSPLRYPGGKSKALKQILPLVPQFEEYREPFVGGGSIFLALKQLYPNKKYWINDLYVELFQFWQIAQQNMPALLKQIEIWKNEFKNGKYLFQYLKENFELFDLIKKASAFFIFNRITFSGTTEAGGFSEQAFQKRFTDSSIQRLSELNLLLNEVQITNEDYEQLINKKGKGVFIFLDPPYFSATKSALYGKRGTLHKQFDHERFAKIMKNCPHQWLITYDNSDYIKKLFSFANIVEWDLMYGMRNQTEYSKQLGQEIFISNFKINSKIDKEICEQKNMFVNTLQEIL